MNIYRVIIDIYDQDDKPVNSRLFLVKAQNFAKAEAAASRRNREIILSKGQTSKITSIVVDEEYYDIMVELS